MVVIVAEWKLPREAVVTKGLRLFTPTIRCSPADMFDMRPNSHSRLNLITALIQAIEAGADQAFATGTLGDVTPVRAIDGRALRQALPGSIPSRLRGLEAALKDRAAS